MATTQEIKNYYINLLIMQFRDKEKARAHIETLITPVVMDQLPLSVRDAFNIDTSVGMQLDVLGKYAGIARTVLTFSGLEELGDSDYRTVVKMKIASNNSNSDLKSIQAILNFFFPDSLRVYDYQNMTMDYWINSDDISLTLAEVFIRNGLLLKPMGVQLKATIYAPFGSKFFGFDRFGASQGDHVGFNTYSDFDTTKKWLTGNNLLTM